VTRHRGRGAVTRHRGRGAVTASDRRSLIYALVRGKKMLLFFHKLFCYHE
jgi:hypothetical protein